MAVTLVYMKPALKSSESFCKYNNCTVAKSTVVHTAPLLKQKFSLVQKQKLLHVKRGSSTVVAMASNKDHAMERYEENDPNFVTAFPLTAVEISSGKDGFVIHMASGQSFRCSHNRLDVRSLPVQAAEPCILLRLDDKEKNLFPLRVADLPRNILIDSVYGRSSLRPTVYQVVADMVDIFGFEIKLVRITHMIHGNICARILIGKVGSEADEVFSLDSRASDAINLAVKARVPIQVNRQLASQEGLHLITVGEGQFAEESYNSRPSEDIPLGICSISEEFKLVSQLTDATEQERYFDAALLRDKLIWYRKRMSKQA